ncbi:amidase [Candidatus Oscillochloris fontis]|uniref:amidase n=1 Tax=Candidatus Oscillochloris fontis TaxID=2496868 RepID=UPI00101BDEF5|nr:amidase [Candidatus Oscillochloris fontis]
MTNLLDRLRTNLRAANIPVSVADLEGMSAKGFLSRVADVERLLESFSSATLPDYLDIDVLPVADTALASPQPMTSIPPANTITALAPQLRTGRLSPVELTRQALDLLAAHDPHLNAFQLVLAEQALADAQAAEAAISAGEYRGPLHGVPVAVKDLLDLMGTPTTAGSKILADHYPSQDATSVALLRQAGAIIIGKTRMSEFAYSPGSNNGHYGPTANPHNPERDSGGSSSGSAAAVAAGIVAAALGTDTGGSIRIPAAQCGIVGLKPTHGRTSLAGAVTLSWSLDHLGPLTRSVSDTAIMLEVLAGPDGHDGRTLRSVPPFHANGLQPLARGIRVGVLGADGSGAPQADPETLAVVRSAGAQLRAAGAEVAEVDVAEIEALRLLNPVILAMEAAALHLPNLRTRLNDYAEFMRQRILASFVYGPATFVQAQQARAVLRQRMTALFEQIDILVLPVVPHPAPPLGVITATTFTGPFNCLGWPAISIPAGFSREGLPLAVQLVARPWEEAELLRVAMVLEA